MKSDLISLGTWKIQANKRAELLIAAFQQLLIWNEISLAGGPEARDPAIHPPPALCAARRPTCQNQGSLLDDWISRQVAGGRELQSLSFPGHRRQTMTWLIFVSLKQRSKLSSQVHTTHHHVRGTCFSRCLQKLSMLGPSPPIFFFRGAVTLLSYPSQFLSPWPSKLEGKWWSRTGEGQGKGGGGRLWPWIKEQVHGLRGQHPKGHVVHLGFCLFSSTLLVIVREIISYSLKQTKGGLRWQGGSFGNYPEKI